jgi:hypothetical protein
MKKIWRIKLVKKFLKVNEKENFPIRLEASFVSVLKIAMGFTFYHLSPIIFHL